MKGCTGSVHAVVSYVWFKLDLLWFQAVWGMQAPCTFENGESGPWFGLRLAKLPKRYFDVYHVGTGGFGLELEIWIRSPFISLLTPNSAIVRALQYSPAGYWPICFPFLITNSFCAIICGMWCTALTIGSDIYFMRCNSFRHGGKDLDSKNKRTSVI